MSFDDPANSTRWPGYPAGHNPLSPGTTVPSTSMPIITPKSDRDRLADAIDRLANAMLGYRTTTIGEMTVTEPVAYRWEPRPCVKCQSRDARVIFHMGDYMTSNYDKPGCIRSDIGQDSAEHLHVHCQVCHFDWTETLPEPIASFGSVFGLDPP